MPGWHEATKELQANGKFQTVGLIQEQHPDRCRLFMQWKRFNWPVMVDSLNLLGVTVVPITLAIDEWGIVRLKNPKPEMLEQEFLTRTFARPPSANTGYVVANERTPLPTDAASAADWIRYGDAMFHGAAETDAGAAVAAYAKAVALDSGNGPANFRLGVAHRKRYDSEDRRKDDFRNAVQHWAAALDLDPNQYIWRRRIQQYGPRLQKPYPFYDWVERARAEIVARGEKPVVLTTEPRGAELAQPSRNFGSSRDARSEPDPGGRVERDAAGLIRAEWTVVPPSIKPGGAARVHVTLQPNSDQRAHWNNESGKTALWTAAPRGWQVGDVQHVVEIPNRAVSSEARTFEFEVRAPAYAAPGSASLATYALYYVCRGADGACLYRRQNIAIPIVVVAP